MILETAPRGELEKYKNKNVEGYTQWLPNAIIDACRRAPLGAWGPASWETASMFTLFNFDSLLSKAFAIWSSNVQRLKIISMMNTDRIN